MPHLRQTDNRERKPPFPFLRPAFSDGLLSRPPCNVRIPPASNAGHRTMEQPDFFDIPSPCIGVCRADDKGCCVGCLRSREERLYWLKMTDGQKHQVMRLIAARRKKRSQTAADKTRHPAENPAQQCFDFT